MSGPQKRGDRIVGLVYLKKLSKYRLRFVELGKQRDEFYVTRPEGEAARAVVVARLAKRRNEQVQVVKAAVELDREVEQLAATPGTRTNWRRLIWLHAVRCARFPDRDDYQRAAATTAKLAVLVNKLQPGGEDEDPPSDAQRDTSSMTDDEIDAEIERLAGEQPGRERGQA